MLRDQLRHIRNGIKAAGWRLGTGTGLTPASGVPVSFLVERADWSIRWDGEHIRDVVNAATGRVVVDTTDSIQRTLASKLVHFGSQYMWLDWYRYLPRDIRYATSFFHGKHEDGPDVARHIDSFLDSVPALTKVVTAASMIERRLLSWGVPREKLVRIPIGVDTAVFRVPSAVEREQARARFGFRSDRVVIGSFQKDGVGWGDGMEPKLIKGPDLFVDAVTRIAGHLPVSVLLTGPARGYVKAELTRRGIPFVHTYVKDQAAIADCYHALDLYLVTSREEGGPKGVMEGMASGVAVVSTSVGMAPDLIVDGITGGLVRDETGAAIAEKALQIIHASDRGSLLAHAREAALATDWQRVGDDHWTRVYQPMLQA